MKNITYNNINSKFSFENVCLELNNFWIKEKLFNNKKIWLTITVSNKQNKSFTLINNLPFNILDYTDVIIVLKQVFDNKMFSNRKDKINNIVFKYYLENKFDWKEYSINVLIFILYSIFLVLSTFIIFYATSVLFNVLLCSEIINNNLDVINENTISSNVIKENTFVKCTNKCLFSVFSDFFDKSNFYRHYPGCFIEYDYPYKYDNIYLPDHAVQYMNNAEALKCDLIAIATECTSILKYL